MEDGAFDFAIDMADCHKAQILNATKLATTAMLAAKTASSCNQDMDGAFDFVVGMEDCCIQIPNDTKLAATPRSVATTASSCSNTSVADIDERSDSSEVDRIRSLESENQIVKQQQRVELRQRRGVGHLSLNTALCKEEVDLSVLEQLFQKDRACQKSGARMGFGELIEAKMDTWQQQVHRTWMLKKKAVCLAVRR